MASGITPEEIRQAKFRTVLRGLDSSEVTRFLELIAAEFQQLTEEKNRMTSRLGDLADRDLESEFESLGREVAAVLQAAREAAESMRERATFDSARWRSEAMAEVEALRKEARSDAEALRGDAWTTGSELLGQAAAEARRLRAEAERDVLTVMGEAEREAHRLTSSARRDAEDVLRAATMDAEKTASEAKKRHDELIQQAYRQAESAQERTRALEQRREELLEELEAVRATLTRLEGSLEERREDLDLSGESTSVRVVPAPGSDPEEKTWALGETVRVIPTGGAPPPAPEPERRRDRSPQPDDDEFVEPSVDLPRQPDVAETQPPEPEPEPKPLPEPEPEPKPLPEPEPKPKPKPTPMSEPEPVDDVVDPEPGDVVGALFASLRSTPVPVVKRPDKSDKTAKAEPETEPKPEPPEVSKEPGPAAAAPPPPSTGGDMIEERDARLLPITNRALRGVKKAVTDAQNLALDSLRTEDDWHPEGSGLAEMMRADLIGLWAESYSAGHTTAEEMMGSRLKRGDTPQSDAAEVFGDDLAGAVSEALIDAGDGQREKQSATSRVFRGWRTDEAERRVRELALIGYHRGVADSLAGQAELEWVPSGKPCSACREASSDPVSHLPPVHAGCECTIALTSV